MIDCIATRAFSHEGQHFQKDRRYSLDEGLFAEWSAAGLVEAAPPKAEPFKAKLKV